LQNVLVLIFKTGKLGVFNLSPHRTLIPREHLAKVCTLSGGGLKVTRLAYFI